MNRKMIILLFLAIIVCGSIFAEDEMDIERAKNRVALTFGLIGADLSYELVLNPYFSVLGQAAYNFWFVADSLSFTGRGRVYPFGKSFFLDMGLGYSNGYNITKETGEAVGHLILGLFTFGLWFSSDQYKEWEEKSGEIKGRVHGFAIQPAIGWNIDTGKPDKMMMPISMGLDIRRAEDGRTITPFFRMGVGYAF